MKKLLQTILLVSLFVVLSAFNAMATFIAGSAVTSTVTNYCPSASSQTFNFPITVFVGSPNSEFIDYVSITAPAGISIAHLLPAASAVSCASGTGAYEGVGTQTVSWVISAASLTTPTGCGFWNATSTGQTRTYTVALTIPANYNSPIAIGYNVGGDGWNCGTACNCGARSCLSGALTLNAYTPPVVTAAVSAPNICLGSSTTFTGGGASTYTWSDGTNTPTDATAFTPPASGTSTYTVTGVDANMCSATSSVSLTVNPFIPPAVTASVSAPNICLGSSAIFTGGGAATYTWTDGTNTPLDGIAYSPSASGTLSYTVTGVDASMCSATASVSLTVDTSIQFTSMTASANNFCATGNATLNVTPLLSTPPSYCNSAFTNVTYEFITNVSYDVINNTSVGNTGGPVNYTAQVANVTVGTPSNLSVTMDPDANDYIFAWIDWNQNGILNDAGEVYTVASNVSSAGPHILSITPPATAINGNTRMRVMVDWNNSTPNPCRSATYGEAEDYTVNVTGGVAPTPGFNSIAWSPATFLNVTNTPQVIATAVNTTTTYIVTGTDANGCTATSSLTLTVNPLPTVNATSLPSPATVCAGGSVTLTGTGTATSYAWTGGAVDGTSFVPLATAVYQVTGTDANMCTATSTINVTVNTGIAFVSNVALPDDICEGEGTSLTATVAGLAYCQPVYTNGTTFGDYVSSVSIPTTTLNNSSAGAAAPYYTLYPASGSTTASLIAGNTYSIILSAGTYTVNDLAAWIDFDQNGLLNDVGEKLGETDNLGAAPATTTFTFTVPLTAFNGATRLRVRDVDHGGTNDMHPCLAQSTYGETEDYIIEITGGTPSSTSYSWSPSTNMTGANTLTPTVSSLSAGTIYTITATAGNTCTSSSTVIVNVTPSPIVSATSSAASICLGSSVTFTGVGNAASYTWSDGTNTPTDATAFTPSAAATSTYTVTGSDGGTCTATSTVALAVNAISTFNAPITLVSTCPTNDGGSVTVSASSASTFAISPSGPLQPSSGVFTSMIGGTNYMVTLTDGNLCTNTTMISATSASNGELANATTTNATSTAGNICTILTQNDNSTLNYYGASCDDLIATIVDASGGNVLGSVNACVTVLPTVPTYNGQPYLPRYYDITPTNQGPADITLYFTQDDFDDYNAAAGSFPQIPAVQATGTATFCISQVPGGFLPGSSGATTIVHTVTATWNIALNRWEVVLPVASFSGFYCHACNPLNSALPASITNFKGTKTETTDLLTWTTTSELNNASFNILYSNDGKNYSRLTSVNSKASNGNSNVTLNYKAENTMPKLGHNYYKLEQVDIDGKSMINTQVVDLMWGANGSTISVYPNPTSDELNIDIYTTKTENSAIKVLDMSGRILKEIQTKLQMGANSIKMNIGELATGIYTIQILENNKITQVSKVEKK